MKNDNKLTILQSPQFKRLVLKRWTFSVAMTLIMLFIYFGFILTIAFNKELLATKLGAHITVGLPIGLAIIIIAWVLTGVYVYWANNSYDKEVNNIKSKMTKD